MIAAVRAVSLHRVTVPEDTACEACGSECAPRAVFAAGSLYCDPHCARADLRVRRELVERDEVAA